MRWIKTVKYATNGARGWDTWAVAWCCDLTSTECRVESFFFFSF